MSCDRERRDYLEDFIIYFQFVLLPKLLMCLLKLQQHSRIYGAHCLVTASDRKEGFVWAQLRCDVTIESWNTPCLCPVWALYYTSTCVFFFISYNVSEETGVQFSPLHRGGYSGSEFGLILNTIMTRVLMKWYCSTVLISRLCSKYELFQLSPLIKTNISARHSFS